jgi:hypothetical protein
VGDDLAAGAMIAAPDLPIVDRERIPLLRDAEGAFRRTYGARTGMVWLIRPDGHIGWRSDRPEPERLDRYLDGIVRAHR